MVGITLNLRWVINHYTEIVYYHKKLKFCNTNILFVFRCYKFNLFQGLMHWSEYVFIFWSCLKLLQSDAFNTSIKFFSCLQNVLPSKHFLTREISVLTRSCCFCLKIVSYSMLCGLQVTTPTLPSQGNFVSLHHANVSELLCKTLG